MGDFYSEVKKSVEQGQTTDFLKRWRGDPRLKLARSPSPVFIKKGVAYQTKESGRKSLQYIFCLAATLEREVAFTCLADEGIPLIREVRFGSVGTYDNCFWETNNCLRKSLTVAERTGLRVVLGHTHPSGYGPVCSNIYYWDDCPYGEDYFMILWRMRRYPNLISRFHIIMTPLDEQIGVFELKSRGRVIYHPLKYVD